jgi:arabinofuranosyltransferase
VDGALQWFLLAVPLVILSVGAWRFRGMVDDGWIYLRIVQNVVAGNGPVFNAGERVEAYTGPLWLAMLSVLGALRPSALPWIAVLTGILATVGGLALAMLGSARIMRVVAPGRVLLPCGALVFASLQGVWTFASTGLETGVTFLWLGSSLWVLVRWAGTGRLPAWGGVLLGLGPLIRPDLAVVSALFLVSAGTVIWRERGARDVGRVIAWALALPVVYQFFRMAYFGELVASTAIAKEGAVLRPDSGWGYLRNLVDAYWLVVPLSVLVVLYVILFGRVEGARWRTAAFALPAAGLLHGLLVVLVGGDYMHARLLLPALFAVTAPLGVVPLRRDFALALIIVPWAVVSVLAFRITPGLTVPVAGIVGERKVTPQDFGATDGGVPPWWRGDGLYARYELFAPPVLVPAPLAAGYPPTVTASIVMGLHSYAQPLDFYTYDPFGLANPLAAHLRLTRRGLPGHEKLIPTPWLVAQLTPPGTPVTAFDRPPLRQEPGLFGLLTPPTSGSALARQTEFARQALQCEPLSDLVNGPRQPLTWQRISDNVLGSFSRTRLRVPPDPEVAYRTFCVADEGTNS